MLSFHNWSDNNWLGCAIGINMRLRISIVAGVLFVMTSLSWGQSCYRSAIIRPSPFHGINGEIFRLVDGSLWEVKSEDDNLCAYNPDVMICPSLGEMIIQSKTLKVKQVVGRKSEPASESVQAPSVEQSSLK